jgi:hypothetical protein
MMDFNEQDIKKYILSSYKKFKKSDKKLPEVFNGYLGDYLYQTVQDKFNTTAEIDKMFNPELEEGSDDGELAWVYWYCVDIEDRYEGRE